MRELGKPRRYVVPTTRQPIDEFFPDLREQRRLASMSCIERTYQFPPGVLAQRGADHREVAGQQALEAVEEQVAVDLQATVFDVGRGIVRRVADVRGEGALLRLQR